MPDLQRYQKILPLFLVPISGLAALFYGWAVFATITDRGGLSGSMYIYYRLTAGQYFVYNSIVFLAETVMVFLQIFYLYKGDRKRLTNVFWLWLIIAAVVAFCEIYLATHFSGKG